MTRHHPAAVRVRLTDQALVAVTAARRAADLDHRVASAVDLLVTLATAEGRAGARLGDLMAGLTGLVERARHQAPRLAGADEVLWWAAGEVTERPLATDDLLAATVELGGSELADVLDAAGVPVTALRARTDEPDPIADVSETFGLDPSGAAGWPLPCARAVARARAAGGSATGLAVAVAADPHLPSPVDPDVVAERVRGELGADWRAAACRHAEDTGVEAVVTAARRGAHRGVVDPLTLVQAVRMAGGALPARLLDAVDEPW